MVALILHITQQKFQIHLFVKMDTSNWSRYILWYLNQNPLSPDDSSTTYTSCTCIFIEHLPFFIQSFGHVLPKVHYNRKKRPHSPTNFVHGSHKISLSILTLTPQNYHCNHIFMYTMDDSPHFCMEKPGHVVFQPKDQKYKSMQPEKELIQLVMVIM